MFTGIVQIIGIVDKVERHKGALRLAVKMLRSIQRIKRGSSVAVNGVCLTAVKKKGNALRFDIVPETVRRTTLGHLKRGSKVNVEPSLRVGEEIGGHLVMGHVDAAGSVFSCQLSGKKEKKITIQVPKKLMKYIAEKGSVAVDGVSLTVAAVKGETFIVALVPYTLRHTTLGGLKKGERVNIEVDMAARYLERLSSRT